MNWVTGLILGGVAVTFAGILSYFRGETYEFTLFSALGAYFFIFSLDYILFSFMGSSFSANGGWIEVVWAVLFFYMWLSVFMEKGIFVFLFLLGLWLTFLDFAIGNWIASRVCIYIGGYIGLATSVLAGWLSAQALWESTKTVQVEGA